jgi:hypothetical protein
MSDGQVTAAVEHSLVSQHPALALGHYALPVLTVHDEDDELAVLEVVPPERADLVAATYVPCGSRQRGPGVIKALSSSRQRGVIKQRLR